MDFLILGLLMTVVVVGYVSCMVGGIGLAAYLFLDKYPNYFLYCVAGVLFIGIFASILTQVFYSLGVFGL